MLYRLNPSLDNNLDQYLYPIVAFPSPCRPNVNDLLWFDPQFPFPCRTTMKTSYRYTDTMDQKTNQGKYMSISQKQKLSSSHLKYRHHNVEVWIIKKHHQLLLRSQRQNEPEGCSLQPPCNPAGSHSVAPHTAASAPAESLSEKQILNLPRLTEPGILGSGPTNCLWRSPPGNSCWYCCCLVAKSCWTLCNPVDCSPPGSSVH